MLLSLIIPAYNEEKRLSATMEKIYQYLLDKHYGWEIIIVDDGSSDGTFDIAADFASQIPSIKILRNGVNRGKGYSVKRGILASKGEFVAFIDADMSTPIEELEKLFDTLKEGYDIAIGSRSIKESRVKIRQPWYRQAMGKIFNMLVRVLFFQNFYDTQCGLKLFNGGAAREIARSMKVEGFCFDVEMLYLAKIKGYRIKEKGIVWNNSPESKVKLFASSASMFIDLIKIRLIHGRKERAN